MKTTKATGNLTRNMGGFCTDMRDPCLSSEVHPDPWPWPGGGEFGARMVCVLLRLSRLGSISESLEIHAFQKGRPQESRYCKYENKFKGATRLRHVLAFPGLWLVLLECLVGLLVRIWNGFGFLLNFNKNAKKVTLKSTYTPSDSRLASLTQAFDLLHSVLALEALVRDGGVSSWDVW